jgi:hypothetical protein
MIKRILKAIKQPILYKDNYIEILRKVNTGMLHPGNILCFDYAIRNLPSNYPIIEIGTFCGLSANTITYFKKLYSKKNILITVDKWPKAEWEGKVGESNISYKDFYKFIQESLMKNLLFFSKDDLPFVFENTSDDFLKNWELSKTSNDIFSRELVLGGKISFAYIDGNHSYEFVARDFQNCDKFLEKGGFILFDDSADFSSWEVRKVIKEVKKNKNYVVVMKNPNYLFQKVN